MILTKIDRALGGRGARGGAEAAPVTSASGEAVAGVIGERFEILNGGLEQLADLTRRFREFETVVEGMRRPLADEFQARRDGHVELINLRSAHADMAERIAPLTAENQRVKEALAAAELKGEELSAQLAEKAAALQDAGLDLDRLRTELSQATSRAQTLESAERDAQQRITELTQDRDSLRTQAADQEARAAAAEAGRAQSARDLSLMTEENEALKRRIEEVGAEIAGLSRAAVSTEGQLASERARAAAEQADAARAMRAMEGQLEAARSEAAALTAKLDAATARAARLDALNGEQAGGLSELQKTLRAAERRGDELQVSLDRTSERCRALETALDEGRQRMEAMETARLAAVDRAETLSKNATAQEKALARADERVAKLQAQIAQIQGQHQQDLQAKTEQHGALKAELERAQADSAIVAAALDSIRRERSGAQTETSGGGASIQAIAG